jgi:hypothetical protein
VPLSNFVPRGFGFVYHSIAILYHEVPNPNLTVRNFCIAVGESVERVRALEEQLREASRRLSDANAELQEVRSPAVSPAVSE